MGEIFGRDSLRPEHKLADVAESWRKGVLLAQCAHAIGLRSVLEQLGQALSQLEKVLVCLLFHFHFVLFFDQHIVDFEVSCSWIDRALRREQLTVEIIVVLLDEDSGRLLRR